MEFVRIISVTNTFNVYLPIKFEIFSILFFIVNVSRAENKQDYCDYQNYCNHLLMINDQLLVVCAISWLATVWRILTVMYHVIRYKLYLGILADLMTSSVQFHSFWIHICWFQIDFHKNKITKSLDFLELNFETNQSIRFRP